MINHTLGNWSMSLYLIWYCKKFLKFSCRYSMISVCDLIIKVLIECSTGGTYIKHII